MQTVSLPAPRERRVMTDASSCARLDEQLDFTLEVEPPGLRGVVTRCLVQRTITENMKDEVDLLVELRTESGVERVHFQWAVDHAPDLDALVPGDVVWLEARGTSFTLRRDPEFWLRALWAQVVRGRWLIPARAQWNFPLFVERLETPHHPGFPPCDQVQLGPVRVGVFEWKCLARLSAVKLDAGSLAVETWSGLVLELADAIEQHHLDSPEEVLERLSWSLTGAVEVGVPTRHKLGPVEAVQVKTLAEVAVPLLSGNTLSSARAGRAFLPATLRSERHAEWRAFLARLARAEFVSLHSVREAVKTLGPPAAREDVVGALFALTPGFFEGLRTLLASPHLLPERWDALGGKSTEVLTVLHDRWAERGFDPNAMAQRVAPPKLRIEVPAPRSFTAGGGGDEDATLWGRLKKLLR